MEFRLERETDYFETENLTREAFWNVYCPGCSEHLILHRLRQADAFLKELDYVVTEDEKIIGNIVYTNMYAAETGEMCQNIICFGPVCVHPDYQGKGIGEKLISETLKKAEEMGFKAVMITGDSHYYSRFGFESASKYGIYLPGLSQEEENEFFMVKELEEGYLKKHPGIYNFDGCFEITGQELEEFEKKFPAKKKREPQEGDLS